MDLEASQAPSTATAYLGRDGDGPRRLTGTPLPATLIFISRQSQGDALSSSHSTASLPRLLPSIFAMLYVCHPFKPVVVQGLLIVTCRGQMAKRPVPVSLANSGADAFLQHHRASIALRRPRGVGCRPACSFPF